MLFGFARSSTFYKKRALFSSYTLNFAPATNKMIKMHQDYFGVNAIESATADKGYYSSSNEDLLLMAGVKEVGIARPGNIKKGPLHSAEAV